MLYRLLADAVLVAHLAFVVFAVLGGLLALRWRWIPIVHLPAAAWAAAIELLGGTCPLTPLENALRRAGGEAGYAGGFIEHHLVPVLYPAGLTDAMQVALGLGVLLVNAAVYAAVVRRARSRRTPAG